MAGSDMVKAAVTGGLVLFGVISWVILMAGVGAFQAWLDKEDYQDPGVIVSYHWWTVWFTLLLLIGAGVAAVLKHRSVIVRPLALLFAVAFTKITITADVAYKIVGPDNLEDDGISRANAILAGAIMLGMVTLALTVWFAAVDALPATNTKQEKDGAGAGQPPPGHAQGGYVINAHPTPPAAYDGSPAGANYAQAGYAPSPGAPPAQAQPGVPQYQQSPPQLQPGVPQPGVPQAGVPQAGVPLADVSPEARESAGVGASQEGAYGQPGAVQV